MKTFQGLVVLIKKELTALHNSPHDRHLSRNLLLPLNPHLIPALGIRSNELSLNVDLSLLILEVDTLSGSRGKDHRDLWRSFCRFAGESETWNHIMEALQRHRRENSAATTIIQYQSIDEDELDVVR